MVSETRGDLPQETRALGNLAQQEQAAASELSRPALKSATTARRPSPWNVSCSSLYSLSAPRRPSRSMDSLRKEPFSRLDGALLLFSGEKSGLELTPFTGAVFPALILGRPSAHAVSGDCPPPGLVLPPGLAPRGDALRAACSRRAPTGIRTRALLAVLFRSGLRP